MNDLVEKVCDIMAPGDDWPGHKLVAMKAIAAVLDDLTDVDATTLETFYRAMDAARRGEHGFLDSVSAGLNAIVDVKRKELGLSAPEKSGESLEEKYEAQRLLDT